jgi:tripartite ATP-independent transporter DctM subunit
LISEPIAPVEPPPSGHPAHAAQRAFFSALDGAVDIVIGAAMLGELAAVLANTFARAVLHYSMLWTDEVGGLALTILAFMGGAIAYQRDHHSSVQTIVNVLPLRYRRACHAVADWLVLIVAAVTGYVSIPLVTQRWGQTTPILQLPAGLVAAPLTVGMALLVIYAGRRLARSDHRTVLWTGVVLIAATALIIATRPIWMPAFAGAVPITVALVLFFVTVLIGLPVAFALILSTIAYLYPTAVTPMIALPQNMADGIGAFILLALPFFIFAGAIMEKGGISLRLVSFVRSLVGHLRGGLLQATVVSIYLVSGLSGSKTADVAAVGMVMRDMLKREGYELEEGASVFAASAAMGETIPPSLGLLVLGSITTLSMGALFTAGLVPAAVIALCLMILIAVRARRTGMPRSARATPAELGRSALAAILPLLMPVIMFGGIRAGIATPTEVSSYAVAYGIFLAVVVYRAFSWRDFGRMVAEASTVSGMILFILAAASTFSWALSAARIPQGLVAIVQGLHGNQVLFLILSIVMLVVCGSLLEGLPAIVILAPLLLPLAGKIGISELHYAIVLLIAMGIGAFLPPLGVGFYVSCAVARTKIGPSSRMMVPYAAVLLVGLLIVAFVPWFTLALPNAFNH